MRLLIVEDDQQFLEAELALLRSVISEKEIRICHSRDSALKAIEEEVFDYAVLDLKIPSEDQGLDAATEHGVFVYERLKSVSPGTPVCFLTGFGTDDFITDRLNEARVVDIWGDGDRPLLRMLRKGRLAELQGIISEVKNQIKALSDIELITKQSLTNLENRIVRISGRRQRGKSIIIEQLSGGLSDMRVLKLTIRDEHGANRRLCAARIGNREDIRAEISSYMQNIVNLPHGTYAVFINEVSFGAGSLAGVFYELMPDLKSLLALVSDDMKGAVEVIKQLEQAERSWTQGRPQTEMTVRAVRRFLVDDETLEALRPSFSEIGIGDFEEKSLQVRMSVQHGDLQPENVLVDKNDVPVLIDFARVRIAPACLDPLTLELSFLFHPLCRTAAQGWPRREQAEQWDSIEDYVKSCPIEPVIREVRRWAEAAADGRRALYATAYSIAMRQFKYEDTDKEIAKAVMRSAIRGADST